MWPDWPPGTRIGSTCARWLKLHLTAKLAPCSNEAAPAVGADARAARMASTHARSIAIPTEAGRRIVFLIRIHLPPYFAGRGNKGVGPAPACYSYSSNTVGRRYRNTTGGIFCKVFAELRRTPSMRSSQIGPYRHD